MSLLGTFLVRTGVLTSVHAFATDPTRGVFILIILILFIGGALSLLLLGRLAWRWSQGAFAGGAMQAGQQASPLTMAFAAALIAYFLVNNIGLMLRMRELRNASALSSG